MGGQAALARRMALAAAAFASLPGPSVAAEHLSAAQTISLPFTSRSTGLNGAFGAVPGGLSSLNFNPAGLYVLKKVGASQATALFSPVGAGGAEEALGYAQRLQKIILAAGYLGYNDPLREPSSGVLARNASTALLNVAFPMGEGLWGGVQARGLDVDSLEDGAAQGYDAGAGLLWDAPVEGLTLGASFQNVGPALRFSGTSIDLPQQARAGAAYDWRYPFGVPLLVLATADGIKPRGGPYGELSGLQISGGSARGMQTLVEGGVSLAGASHSASMGFGMAYKSRWTLDYSFTFNNGGLSPLNTITIGCRFRSGKK